MNLTRVSVVSTARVPAALARFMLPAALVASACSDTENSYTGPEVLTRRDSSGVTLVEVPARAVEALPRGAVVDSVLLSIGAEEGDSAYLLYRVAAAWRMEDGSIAVADGGSLQIRVFNAAGRFLQSIGGAGEGPHEYRGWAVLSAAASDQIAIFDPVLSRISTVHLARGEIAIPAPDAPICQMEPDARRLMNCEVTALLSDGTQLTEHMKRNREPIPPGRVVQRSSQRLLLLGQLNHVVLDSVPTATTLRFVGEPTGFNVPFWSGEAPYTPKGLIAAGRDRVVVANTGRFEYRTYDAAGRLQQIVRVFQPAVEVTSAILRRDREWAESESSLPPEVRRYLSRLRPEGHVPFFDRMLIDASDRVWLRTYQHPAGFPTVESGENWIVFSPEGAPLARVEDMPVRPLEIGGDYVLLLDRDSYGVERVRLKRLLLGSTNQQPGGQDSVKQPA